MSDEVLRDGSEMGASTEGGGAGAGRSGDATQSAVVPLIAIGVVAALAVAAVLVAISAQRGAEQAQRELAEAETRVGSRDSELSVLRDELEASRRLAEERGATIAELQASVDGLQSSTTVPSAFPALRPEDTGAPNDVPRRFGDDVIVSLTAEVIVASTWSERSTL